jgi:hypothetical protein
MLARMISISADGPVPLAATGRCGRAGGRDGSAERIPTRSHGPVWPSGGEGWFGRTDTFVRRGEGRAKAGVFGARWRADRVGDSGRASRSQHRIHGKQ